MLRRSGKTSAPVSWTNLIGCIGCPVSLLQGMVIFRNVRNLGAMRILPDFICAPAVSRQSPHEGSSCNLANAVLDGFQSEQPVILLVQPHNPASEGCRFLPTDSARQIMPIGMQGAPKMDPHSLKKLQEFAESIALPWIGLAVALLLLAAFVHGIRSRYRDDDGLADEKAEILEQMRDLRREGDLSEEEFRSIKSQLTGRSHPPKP